MHSLLNAAGKDSSVFLHGHTLGAPLRLREMFPAFYAICGVLLLGIAAFGF